MFKYLQDYDKLPQALRDNLSQPAVVSAIQNLEFKYSLKLASLIMRIMIKDVDAGNLVSFLLTDLKMPPEKARELAFDLKHSVFFSVNDYVYGNASPEIYNKPSVKSNANIAIPKPASAIPPPTTASDPFEVKAQVIIRNSGIMFGSRDLNQRLKQIVLTALRGIRSSAITKESLVKPVDAGGLDFDEEMAQKLLSAIEANHAPSELTLTEILEDKSLVRDVDYDFSKLTPKKSAQPIMARLDVAHELEAGPLPAVIEKLDEIFPLHADLPKKAIPSTSSIPTAPIMPPRSSLDIAWPKNQSQAQQLASEPDFGSLLHKSLSNINDTDDNLSLALPNAESPKTLNNYTPTHENYPGAPLPMPADTPKSDTGKIIMSDVRAHPRIYSPIDELTFMTIKNFRQLSKNPQVGIELIKRKIQAIILDDFGKKVEAINAWKQSPINRMYVSVLKDSLNSGQPAAKGLLKKRKEDPEFFSDAEFEAVMQLNRELSVI